MKVRGKKDRNRNKMEKDDDHTNDATPPLFAHAAIFPGDKRAHMRLLHRRSGVAFGDMLFFDDEARNGVVRELGVVMRLVRNGCDAGEVDAGVREWRRMRRGS